MKAWGCLYVVVLAMAFICGPGFDFPAWAQRGIVISMPVRSADFAGVLDCYKDDGKKDAGGFCDRCRAQNLNNVSLLNYVILREALRSGGMDARIFPIESPNSERSRKMVESGMATVKSDWAFNIDGDKDVIKTSAFIRAGTFVKGVYGLAGNAKLQSVRTRDDLHDLKGVMNPNWRLDWKIMQSLGAADIFPVSTTAQVFRLIGDHRADFSLFEFSPAQDMGRSFDHIRLVPVPGIKVVLPESQHFMVSRRFPLAHEVAGAIDKGLVVIADQGLIDRCLRQSGVLNPRVKDWFPINMDRSANARPAGGNDANVGSPD
jgi:hypothetical protein